MIVTVKVAVPSLPASSMAVAVQTEAVSVSTTGAVKVFVATSKLPPFVQVTVGPVVTAILSVAVSVAVPVAPEKTVNVPGLKVTVGASVSGTIAVIVTVKVAVPWFPAASLAVAVQILCVSTVTAAAVNIFVVTSKSPPFVQVTFGPFVIPTASVAVSVEVPVDSDSTLNVVGLKDTAGAVVSAAGGGGGGVVVVPPLLPPPPQADKSSADASESTGR